MRPDASEAGVTLRLPYRAPFAWDALADFLAHRAISGVETATRAGCRRALRVGDAVGTVAVRPLPDADALEARLEFAPPVAIDRVVARIRGVFDLDADPAAIGARLAADPTLAARWHRLPGVRVPGAWSGFELAVRAILGQQVSVRGATTLAGRLVARCGERAGAALLFPTPERLAGADLGGLGLTGARVATIDRLARAVAGGRLDLDGPAAPATLAALHALPGIGPWTVQYVAMRALRDPDAFLPTDVGVLRALARDGVRPTPRAAAERAEGWRPWRAYALMLLWLSGDGGNAPPIAPAPTERTFRTGRGRL
ncbi:MAG: DNA-3-methyladenine glycosylase 2 family protein [bacterium]|nr:DNA-3-methyladenine glycosylase 2 family protein [bacterium]